MTLLYKDILFFITDVRVWNWQEIWKGQTENLKDLNHWTLLYWPLFSSLPHRSTLRASLGIFTVWRNELNRRPLRAFAPLFVCRPLSVTNRIWTRDWDWPLLCGCLCIHDFTTSTRFRSVIHVICLRPRMLSCVEESRIDGSVKGQYATICIGNRVSICEIENTFE